MARLPTSERLPQRQQIRGDDPHSFPSLRGPTLVRSLRDATSKTVLADAELTIVARLFATWLSRVTLVTADYRPEHISYRLSLQRTTIRFEPSSDDHFNNRDVSGVGAVAKKLPVVDGIFSFRNNDFQVKLANGNIDVVFLRRSVKRGREKAPYHSPNTNLSPPSSVANDRETSSTDLPVGDSGDRSGGSLELSVAFIMAAANRMDAGQRQKLSEAAQRIEARLPLGDLDVPLHQLPDEERLTAPRALWTDRLKFPELATLSVPDFVLEVYGPRLGKGFTQADIRKLDPSLYNAIQRYPEGTWPESVDLPTLEDWNHRQLTTMGLTRWLESPELRKWLSIASSRAQRLDRKLD